MRRETVAIEGGLRLDRFVAAAWPELTRSAVQRLIQANLVWVDGQPARASYRVSPGDRITVEVPAPSPSELEPEAIPLDVVYEDADVLVINKPAGLVVHPAPGHAGGTLVNAVLAMDVELEVSNTQRPGIVHRLDKDTSGLMVVAKNDRAQLSLSEQMQRHEMKKEYLALVWGHLTPFRGIIDAPIGRDPRDRKRMGIVASGRPARTHFRVLEQLDGFDLVRLRLETGRTHQIRVHMASLGHPVVGDRVYGPEREALGLKRQFLHAYRLGFVLPSGGYREFVAPLPGDLREALDALGSAFAARLPEGT